MTSGNKVDEPICIGNREALKRLHGIADFFLLHNRDILVRCDDSVETCVRGRPALIRRSRGWAPKPFLLSPSFPPVLALGGHLKATLCILTGKRAYLSPHIGDLETPEARDFFREMIPLMERIANAHPQCIACDLHPAYWTSRLAETLPHEELIRVQHHHAHIVSVMAERGLSSPVIGLSMDGTGYGTDGTIWGGEVLLASRTHFERAAHFLPFPLPGAERAVKEPWRSAVGLLSTCYSDGWTEVAGNLPIGEKGAYFPHLQGMMAANFQSPLTSSLGRLFDAVAAISGLRLVATFEGQAAMELEAAALKGSDDRGYRIDIAASKAGRVLDVRSLVQALIEDRSNGVSLEDRAYSFHLALVRCFSTVAQDLREEQGYGDIVLSGGCFQNHLLLAETITSLERARFRVYSNDQLPMNDGNIALGQAVVAGATVLMRNYP